MICHKRKIICLLIPKNASSTLKYALKKNGFESLPMCKNKLGHATLSDIKQLRNYDTISNYKILSVIRNPEDRSQSLYKMFYKYFLEYGYNIDYIKNKIWFEKQSRYVDEHTKIIKFETMWTDLEKEIPQFTSFRDVSINSAKIIIDVPNDYLLFCRKYYKEDYGL